MKKRFPLNHLMKEVPPIAAAPTPAQVPELPGEKVLVFPAHLVDWGKTFAEQKVMTDDKDILLFMDYVLNPKYLEYRNRSEVETDEKWKQVIPYCVLKLAGKVFKYQRTKKGGENRLHDKWSVGVGGHINPIDGDVGQAAYNAAMRRELDEEVSLQGIKSNVVRGVIYDDSDAVGRVHVGIVHVIDLDPSTHKLEFKDPALGNGSFEYVNMLKQNPESFENWSQLVIKHISIMPN